MTSANASRLPTYAYQQTPTVIPLGWAIPYERLPRRVRRAVAFSDRVQRDERVTNVIVTARDGIMLIRRA